MSRDTYLIKISPFLLIFPQIEFQENGKGKWGIQSGVSIKEEGRHREAAFKDGKYIDIIEFVLLGANLP